MIAITKETIKKIQSSHGVPFLALTRDMIGNFKIEKNSQARIKVRLRRDGSLHINIVIPK